jgi:hypothetical protein
MNDDARGFRPTSRSRARIAAGALLILAAVATVLVVFDSVDQRQAVLQVVNDVPAGTQLARSDLRVVEVSVDPSLAVVPATQMSGVVGTYAKVRIVAGGLVAQPLLQAEPLVAPGASVLAVSVPPAHLPIGLRERSQVLLVIAPQTPDQPVAEPVIGRVVGLPSTADQVTGEVSVSVELDADDAVTVAAADAVRIVLLDPGIDPAGQVAA